MKHKFISIFQIAVIKEGGHHRDDAVYIKLVACNHF